MLSEHLRYIQFDYFSFSRKQTKNIQDAKQNISYFGKFIFIKST